MLRPALAALACSLVAPAAAAPRGRVVRVERPRGKPAGTPRICSVSPGEVSAYCIGKQPEVGERNADGEREQLLRRGLVRDRTALRVAAHRPRPELFLMDRRTLLAAEHGTLWKEAETRIALVYPSPYRAAMSSLGYQQIYRALHAMPGVAADRAMLPDGDGERVFVTLEEGRPVGGYPMLAYSVAYELEIAGVVETLARAGIPALRDERQPHHPLVVAGGPLTFSNPAPLAPFCDVIIVGEGEQLICELVTVARDVGFAREPLWAALAGRPGFYLPHVHGELVPDVAAAADELLPARSVIATPHTELA